jgi:hypothetical protein
MISLFCQLIYPAKSLRFLAGRAHDLGAVEQGERSDPMTHLTSALSLAQGTSRRHLKIEPGIIIAATILLGLFAAEVALILLNAPTVGPEALLGISS